MRKFLLSTAILAGLSGVAVAQDASTSGMFRSSATATELRASTFIGMRVYASEKAIDANEYNGMQQDWNDIGEINDVILSREGKVDAVLVDIGGFLGMGERQVAVSMDAIKFVSDASTIDAPDDFFLVMTAARTDLEAAPDYMSAKSTMATDKTVASQAGIANGTETSVADAVTGEPAVRKPMERDGYLAAEPKYLTAEKLTGATVYDANDESIGEIGKLILSDDGQVTQAIIDVGGFLGMGEKPIALKLTDIDILRNDSGDEVRVYLSKTKAELEAMPSFEG